MRFGGTSRRRALRAHLEPQTGRVKQFSCARAAKAARAWGLFIFRQVLKYRAGVRDISMILEINDWRFRFGPASSRPTRQRATPRPLTRASACAAYSASRSGGTPLALGDAEVELADVVNLADAAASRRRRGVSFPGCPPSPAFLVSRLVYCSAGRKEAPSLS